MSFRTEWVRYGGEQEYSGLAIWPERASQPLPAVIVVQEAWGVDGHIEDVTRRFAAAGYVAFAPDLFAKGGARKEPFTRERLAELQAFMNAVPAAFADQAAREAELAKRPVEEANRIRETMTVLFTQGLRADQYMPQMTATSTFLRHELRASKGQKVASVGFCMGGAVSALLACHDPELAGAAIFYGAAPAEEQIPKIRCPIIGFYGGLDQRVNAGIPAFTEAMKRHEKQYESHIYEGAPHAFFNDNRPAYHPVATRDAFVRLLQFFQGVLGSAR